MDYLLREGRCFVDSLRPADWKEERKSRRLFGGVVMLTSGEASKMVGARSEENPDGGLRVEDRSEESPKMVVARSEGGTVDRKMR
jgi:hypothetical protein